jgi:prepilin-type N-terminal cleavage/methylation domain-containing protein
MKSLRRYSAGFTHTPIRTVVGQGIPEKKQICRQISNSLAICKLVWGFTLIEILIVAAIIGILAAIAIPEFLDSSQQAKETAAKENLQIIRNAIERYAAKNGGTAPGYSFNNPTAPVLEAEFCIQLVKKGYLINRPENPFNNLITIKMVKNNESLPIAATGQYGWIYKPATKTFKIDWPDKDSQGESYYDY